MPDGLRKAAVLAELMSSKPCDLALADMYFDRYACLYACCSKYAIYLLTGAADDRSIGPEEKVALAMARIVRQTEIRLKKEKAVLLQVGYIGTC